jgi:hypothetical protein
MPYCPFIAVTIFNDVCDSLPPKFDMELHSAQNLAFRSNSVLLTRLRNEVNRLEGQQVIL